MSTPTNAQVGKVAQTNAVEREMDDSVHKKTNKIL
jgi:hypothetical protein